MKWLIDGYEILDPAEILDYANREGTPADFWQRANSITIPRGRQPSRAWLLMRRGDLTQLVSDFYTLSATTVDQSSSATNHTITIATGQGLPDGSAEITHSWARMVFVRAFSVSRCPEDDADAVYLCEFADERILLQKTITENRYNIRKTANCGSASSSTTYVRDTLSSGSIWTWQTMIGDLWGDLPSVAGTAPTLPYSPDGTPEHWEFSSDNLWDAINDVLDNINCAVKFDPDPLNQPYSFLQLGTEQETLSDAISHMRKIGRELYNYDVIGSIPTETPETFIVAFDRFDCDCSTDSPITYQEEVASGITGAQAGTYEVLWNDMLALNEDGAIGNSSDLATRAAEVASNAADRWSWTNARRRQIFAGIATDKAFGRIEPGSELSRVVWRDYGDNWGTVTELIGGPPQMGERMPRDRSKFLRMKY